ncbi:MAG: hypothetical protein O7G84_01280 [Gammaproteobacteria bacterium]|nr:hypothetical protein [Gammaproteobacteria bacterium]
MRNRTYVDPRTGRTIKSGLNLQEEGKQSSFIPRGTIYRAVVLRTFATDDSVRTEGLRKDSTRLYEVECDILLTSTRVPKSRVPVMQYNHGVNDARLWIPRPSTRVVGNASPLNLTRVSRRGTLQSLPPNFEDLDGDQVLVQFIEGDPEKPIIVGAMSHAKTKRLVTDGSGWTPGTGGAGQRGGPELLENYMRFRGFEMRINDAGDVLFDTVGSNPIDGDTETPNPVVGGQVRFRLKGPTTGVVDSQRYVVEIDGTDILEVFQALDGLLQIQMVGGSEQFIRGTTHAANLSTLMTAAQTFTNVAAIACSSGAALSVGPLAAFKPVWIALGNAFNVFGGMIGPSLDPGIVPIPPATAPVGVFSATLVDGQALSTKIRGD